MAAVEISYTSTGHTYVGHAVIVRASYKRFLLSNFADGKNTRFMNCILSRPTLSIAVTETAVKAQGSLWRETETMEFESRSHLGQTILLSACTSSAKVPTVATQLSLALNKYFASLTVVFTPYTDL